MKVLIAYFSQTGNTEKIAKAVHEVVSGSHETAMKRLEELKADDLGGYDLVFLGTPIHAGGLSGAAAQFMDSLPSSPPYALASLVTHASALYMNEGFERGLKQIEDTCKNKSIRYMGCFHCQGKLDPRLHDMVKKMQNVPDDEWKKRMDETDRHPGAEDEQNARRFAEEVISGIK